MSYTPPPIPSPSSRSVSPGMPSTSRATSQPPEVYESHYEPPSPPSVARHYYSPYAEREYRGYGYPHHHASYYRPEYSPYTTGYREHIMSRGDPPRHQPLRPVPTSTYRDDRMRREYSSQHRDYAYEYQRERDAHWYRTPRHMRTPSPERYRETPLDAYMMRYARDDRYPEEEHYGVHSVRPSTALFTPPAQHPPELSDPGPSTSKATRPRRQPREEYSDDDDESELDELDPRNSKPTVLGKRPRDVNTIEDDDSEDDDAVNIRDYHPGKVDRRVILDKNGNPCTGNNGQPKYHYYNEANVKLEIVKIDIPGYEEGAWKQWTKKLRNGQWRCTFPMQKNGVDSICGKTERGLGGLRRHIEAPHMNIEPFQCTWCKKKFTQRANGEGSHMNLHTGELVSCGFCTHEGFKDNSKLSKHVAREHPEQTASARKRRRLEEAREAIIDGNGEE